MSEKPAGGGQPPVDRHQLDDASRNRAAAVREQLADARDVVAEKRDEAVSREAFLADRADFRSALQARQSAARRSLAVQDRPHIISPGPSRPHRRGTFSAVVGGMPAAPSRPRAKEL